MKIKRFEAGSMTGALKKIKHEFGEDAVILSAKSVKKSNGLLSAKRSSKVIVTAAVDTPSVPSGKESPAKTVKTSTTRHAANADTESRAIGKLAFLKRFNPITRTGQQKLQTKFESLATQHHQNNDSDYVYQRLLAQGVKDAIARDFNNKASVLVRDDAQLQQELESALSHIIQAKEIVEPPRQGNIQTPCFTVMVGPTGAGKTTMVAKLAAMQVKQKAGSAAFLSFDNQRVAGCAELKRYADILGIELVTVSEPQEIAPLLKRLSRYELVVVDTPGLAGDDTVLRAHLKCMIEAIPDADVHLLINADTQNRSMAKIINFFKSVGIQRLGFSRMDWTDAAGGMINQALEFDIPITYLSNTPRVTEAAQYATADVLSNLLLTGSDQSLDARDGTEIGSPKEPNGNFGIYYVANRNSDIFHKSDCQSVKRINPENMIQFNDPAEAMGRQFKPCRMCSGELLVSKPIRRVAYQYASTR